MGIYPQPLHNNSRTKLETAGLELISGLGGGNSAVHAVSSATKSIRGPTLGRGKSGALGLAETSEGVNKGGGQENNFHTVRESHIRGPEAGC